MPVCFVQSSANPCIHVQGDDSPVVVAAYVHDLIIATKAEEEMQQVVALLPVYNSRMYYSLCDDYSCTRLLFIDTPLLFVLLCACSVEMHG